MKQFHLYLLLLLFTFSFSSCMDLKEPELKKVEELRIISMTPQGIEVEISARIYNPNKIGFKVDSEQLELFLNNKPFGKAKMKKSFKVKASSEELYTFRVIGTPSNPSNLLMDGLGILLPGNKGTTVQVKGNLKGSAYGFSKKYPVNISHRL